MPKQNRDGTHCELNLCRIIYSRSWPIYIIHTKRSRSLLSPSRHDNASPAGHSADDSASGPVMAVHSSISSGSVLSVCCTLDTCIMQELRDSDAEICGALRQKHTGKDAAYVTVTEGKSTGTAQIGLPHSADKLAGSRRLAIDLPDCKTRPSRRFNCYNIKGI